MTYHSLRFKLVLMTDNSYNIARMSYCLKVNLTIAQMFLEPFFSIVCMPQIEFIQSV